MNEKPRTHHFVPQFWIKRFSSKDDKLWAYDWNDDRIKERSPKKLMQITNLYTLQPENLDDTTLETVDLGKIDREGNAIFDRVLNGLRMPLSNTVALYLEPTILNRPGFAGGCLV